MLYPRHYGEVAKFFLPQQPTERNPSADELLEGVSELKFPKRTVAYPAVLAHMFLPILEALLRNRKIHYGKPGEIMPENHLYSFDGLTPALKEYKASRASHKAVMQVYHHKFGENLFLDLTFDTDHGLGLRGRSLVVEKIMKNALCSGAISSISSIACGAGEAVIQAIAAARDKGTVVRAGFFDVSEAALGLAETLSREAGIEGSTAFYRVNVIKNRDWFTKLPFDGHELVGIIDYIPDGLLVEFLRSLKSPNLKFLLTCNILKKPGFRGWYERMFVHHGLQWAMYYRTPRQLRRIFREAGYNNVHLITEPNELFTTILWVAS